MAKGFGVSPITNTIYYGTINKEKQKFTGNKEDVTKDVIMAVYQWFMGHMGDDVEEYKVTYQEDAKYELVMRTKQQ